MNNTELLQFAKDLNSSNHKVDVQNFIPGLDFDKLASLSGFEESTKYMMIQCFNCSWSISGVFR